MARTDLKTLALFCKVVDNFGDIGICWRLARQLHQEHQIKVQLWVDDLASFKRICPEVSCDMDQQMIEGVDICFWRNQDIPFTAAEISDIVIEFFACDIPPAYIQAMTEHDPKPVWFNLEGLTAEDWVEGCHTLPSSHPQLPLTKYFFFPGFNQRTGGLMFEEDLEQRRQNFANDQSARDHFLRQLGAQDQDLEAFKVSLFCYPHAPILPLLEAWSASETPHFCLVPQGVAQASIETFFGTSADVGKTLTKGQLRLLIISFVPQNDYDKLLWACDFNFVRGEDSFVRAQWAQRPFVWHIYPQDEQLHHKKLRAFLNTFKPATNTLRSLNLAWNEVLPNLQWAEAWKQIRCECAEIEQESGLWAQEMHKNGDLSANLLKFARALRQNHS
ncbi:elongation factor P maturation arginine rhamnosyltransferase EarP [Undibacterium sp. LX40W]|uniref:Protein-arginine rhamnosyltransferase n=1 Tax=Undibacterium nitidum TaxID=2762298 RepID=A0A923KMV5_9BURK|nr:elongation factor P maturation arginine rhamnosyltransferase EarP [Undibacterium nitidum]MBC3893548.1 elongation factor P maturation arginine rhamnosyltransferase EarP [Undibacterium sp. LX40W]